MENIILYDGICNLCNWIIQLVKDRDRHNRFSLIALQSEKGNEVIMRNGLKGSAGGSVILLTESGVYYRSEAALRICRLLGGGFKFLYIFIIIPPVLRDRIYLYISRNRYRWFGMSEYNHCNTEGDRA